MIGWVSVLLEYFQQPIPAEGQLSVKVIAWMNLSGKVCCLACLADMDMSMLLTGSMFVCGSRSRGCEHDITNYTLMPIKINAC